VEFCLLFEDKLALNSIGVCYISVKLGASGMLIKKYSGFLKSVFEGSADFLGSIILFESRVDFLGSITLLNSFSPWLNQLRTKFTIKKSYSKPKKLFMKMMENVRCSLNCN
jgi:hypothetical protein